MDSDGPDREQARLPESMERSKRIDLMAAGEEVYTYHWALFVDYEGAVWLRGDAEFSHEFTPRGTMKMKVKKVGHKRFEVWSVPGVSYEASNITKAMHELYSLQTVVKIHE